MGSNKRSVKTDRPKSGPSHFDHPGSGPSTGNELHPNPLKVLIVENAPDAIKNIIECISANWWGSVLIITGRGSDAIQIAQTTMPDILLLDLDLPDLYGLQVLKEIRAFSDVPIIILSTRNFEETTRLRSIEIGATDYLVVRSFSVVEFLGSLTAALGHGRRRHRSDSQSLVVNLLSRYLSRSGVESVLTAEESKILVALLRNHSRLVSEDQLMQEGWGKKSVEYSLLAFCIKQLQLKLGDDPAQPRSIHLHPNLGYSLTLFG